MNAPKRLYGPYRGVVVSTRDPLNAGRIQAQVPKVFGGSTTGWISPKQTAGLPLVIPNLGGGVWIEFEGGDPSYPLWTGTFGTQDSRVIVLDDLAGVTVPAPANNDVLRYNSATGEWGSSNLASMLSGAASNETFVIASQAAMLSLLAQQGDIAIRTDVVKSFVLAALPTSTLANWKELLASGATGPAGTITSATAIGLAVGASPTITLGGTASARTLAFGIPVGATGATGAVGAVGLTGATGPTGPDGTFLVSTTAPTSPAQGDTWFNSGAGRFYVYYDNFWVEISANKVGPTGAQGPLGPGSQVTVSPTAPTTSVNGDLWFDATDGQTYIRYVDADSSQWVAVAGASATSAFQLGAITPWAAAAIPSWALELTGQAVSRTVYSGLFALLGTSYGAGNGTTTFNVPDYRGRTLVGHDASQPEFDVLGETGGAKTHTNSLSGDGYAKIWIANNSTNIRAKMVPVSPSIMPTDSINAGGASTQNFSVNHAVELGGNTDSGSSLQPYTVVKWIICAATSSGNFDTEVQTALVSNVSTLQAGQTSLQTGVSNLEVGFRLVETLYITSSTTFTKAYYPWLRALRVKCQGGGGGSGGVGATAAVGPAVGGSGGGGGYHERFVTDIAGLAESTAVAVGAGGAAGTSTTAGGTGGTTTAFACNATGGGGGQPGVEQAVLTGSAGPGGVGGSPSGSGDLGVRGGDAHAGFALHSNRTYVGTAGGSVFSGAASPGGASGGTGRGATTGAVFGGGAQAASNSTSQPARNGAAGGAGIIIVELYA